MRAPLFALAFAAFFLIACETDVPEPLPTAVAVFVADPYTPVPATLPVTPQPAPELRIATLGEPGTGNVWALFDESGATYWSKATQGSYWPSLYRLAPPSWTLQPATARGAPAPVLCDAATCTATVPLQPGLSWSDGSGFTAADVVFTVNTALQFRLGLYWREAYDPEVLDRAEALDDFTVKFYFKTKPRIVNWQYGALLGPVVNQTYWQPRIQDALNLQPEASLLTEMQELEAELAWRQTDLDTVERALAVLTPESPAYLDAAKKTKHMQNDLTGLQNKLKKKQAEYEVKLSEAREALLNLESIDEPSLGPWKFASNGPGGFENQAYPGTPLGSPSFRSVRYRPYPDDAQAMEALVDNEVDMILTPDGLSPGAISELSNNVPVSLWISITRSGRFLAFNHANPDLADPSLHRALACMLDPQALIETLGSDAAPLAGFVLDESWRNPAAALPCSRLTGDGRLAEAIRLLKVAGYTWENEPATRANGSGLKGPGGYVLPSFTLLTLEQEPLRELAALYIRQQGKLLGLTIDVRAVSKDELLYNVYSSGRYDLALVGWHLGMYPSYLCEWFVPFDRNPFAYGGSRSAAGGDTRLLSACNAWAQTTDLDLAKAYAFEIQSVLMEDLPLVPLYTGVRVDAYRNIRFPFGSVVAGLGELYGAPDLAIPLP